MGKMELFAFIFLVGFGLPLSVLGFFALDNLRIKNKQIKDTKEEDNE